MWVVDLGGGLLFFLVWTVQGGGGELEGEGSEL